MVVTAWTRNRHGGQRPGPPAPVPSAERRPVRERAAVKHTTWSGPVGGLDRSNGKLEGSKPASARRYGLGHQVVADS
jgi:hypothetical protein